MKAYYFANSRLFGAYHPPKNPGTVNKGVVLCYPIGQEYFRSHRAFLQLAKLINIAGLPVFRFDYYGTGDSLGESLDWGVDQWVSDILSAINELKLISGVDEVALVGLRFGALLATLALQRVQINQAVFWSPIVFGDLYIESLEAMQQKILVSPAFFQVPRIGNHAIESEQLLGFSFPEQLKASVRKLNLASIPHNRFTEIGVIVEKERNDYSRLVASLTASGVGVGFQVLSDAGEWEGVSTFESVLSSYETLSAITSFVCGPKQ